MEKAASLIGCRPSGLTRKRRVSPPGMAPLRRAVRGCQPWAKLAVAVGAVRLSSCRPPITIVNGAVDVTPRVTGPDAGW